MDPLKNVSKKTLEKIVVLQEADYREQDEFRAKIADQNQWMDFETKTRQMVQKLLQPVVQSSILNRENFILLKAAGEDLTERT